MAMKDIYVESASLTLLFMLCLILHTSSVHTDEQRYPPMSTVNVPVMYSISINNPILSLFIYHDVRHVNNVSSYANIP